MRTVLALLAIIVPLTSAPAAQAYDQCDKLFATPDEFKAYLLKETVQSAPVKYFDKAKSIRIETERADRLIPFAAFDSQQNPIVVYPASFPPVLCRLVLTTYLAIQTNSDLLKEPARDAGRCIAANRPRETCIRDYAKDLEQRYRAAFAKEVDRSKRIAYGITLDAIGQLAKHEFAHHLLDHPKKVRDGAIARIDAEFEADFYAVLIGVQTGQAVSAMYYFFSPLEAMEDNAPETRSSDYESASCRATNINDVTGAFGLAPAVLLDAVRGGGAYFSNTPPDYIRTVAQELAQQKTPQPSADSCGRLAAVVLSGSHEELKRLTAMVAEYADILPVPPEKKDKRFGEGLSDPKTFKLVARLQRASQELTYLKGLAARALSYLIHRVEIAGAESSMSRELDDVIQSSEAEYLSGDYGRMLNVRAVSILYDKASGPIEGRMNRTEPLFRKAVEFLPTATEAWMNLGFIALARGDCSKAAEMADQAVRTGDEPERSEAEQFRNTVRGFSPADCVKAGRAFSFGESR